MRVKIGDYRVRVTRSSWTGKEKFMAQRRRMFIVPPFAWWSDLTPFHSKSYYDAKAMCEADRDKRWFGRGETAIFHE